jgi:hypothetical protein
MSRKQLFGSALVVALGLTAVWASLAQADPAKDAKPAASPEFKLPPGWTMEDLQACMMAGTPGEKQKQLAKEIGDWKGQSTMWMAPGADPIKTECSSKVTSLMDGRYVKIEFAGEMPGMGPYTGLGVVAYDNVAQKFQSTWLDNHSTGIMFGTGAQSADGKTLTWKYDYTCPLTKKPAVMRQVETMTSPTTKTLEMFGNDPKSGKEFKMMSIELTKK